jgi:hypothetical protein
MRVLLRPLIPLLVSASFLLSCSLTFAYDPRVPAIRGAIAIHTRTLIQMAPLVR